MFHYAMPLENDHDITLIYFTKLKIKPHQIIIITGLFNIAAKGWIEQYAISRL